MKKYLFLIFLSCAVFSNENKETKLLDYLNNNSIAEKLSIDWFMDKRFGLDENGDGKIDILNSYEYVNPDKYSATVFLAGDGVLLQRLESTSSIYKWTFFDNKGKEILKMESFKPSIKVQLPLGAYTVNLIGDNKGKKFEVKGSLLLRDILIACIGDSFSSGEGSPETIWGDDKPSLWSDGGSNVAQTVEHIRAHRSSLAWGPQAAMFLENFDNRSSITFVFLPISGAMIDVGILEEKSPLDDSYGKHKFAPQIDDLKKVVGSREIDSLWMSIGGNDLSLVSTLILLLMLGPTDGKKEVASEYSKKYLEDIKYIEESVKTGLWSDKISLVKFFKLLDFSAFNEKRSGLDKLPSMYDSLAAKLKELKIKEVCLLDYPSPVKSGSLVADGFLNGFRVSPYESTFINDKLFKPLLKVIKESCERNGWIYVAFENIDFSKHTIEMRYPNPPEKYKGNQYIQEGVFPSTWEYFKENIQNREVRWYRTEEESVIMQGGSGNMKKPTVFSTNGSFHPNEFAYQAMMHELLIHMSVPENYPNYKWIYNDIKTYK